MLKAVIFDMDGLMIDTENVTYQCYKDVLKTMNLEMTKAFYTTLLGRTMEATRRAMFDQYGEDFPIEEVAKKVVLYDNLVSLLILNMDVNPASGCLCHPSYIFFTFYYSRFRIEIMHDLTKLLRK